MKEERLADAVVRQGAEAIDVERALVLLQGFGVIAQPNQLLTLADRDLYADRIIEAQDTAIGVKHDSPGLTESF